MSFDGYLNSSHDHQETDRLRQKKYLAKADPHKIAALAPRKLAQ